MNQPQTPLPILTPRLALVAMNERFLGASLAGERTGAQQALGAAVPDQWLEDSVVMRIFLGKLAADAAAGPWLARAVVLREIGLMIGHCGFHGPPGASYLAEYAPGGVEMGYTVYPAYRRRGYALEAVRGLMAWARSEGVETFVLSIAPENAPSQAIARRLGFARVGSHVDEEDGLEEIFVLGGDSAKR